MSLFYLPTTAVRHDSNSQALRYDVVAPTSALPNAGKGGGSVTFQVDTPANNWFVPSMSYFDFRIRVLETRVVSSADVLSAIDAGDGSGSDKAQFAEYPASHLVTNYSHSIAGVTLENVSDCPELSAVQTRTMLNREILDTLGASFRMKDIITGANSDDPVPGANTPLQPWGGSVTTFSCGYQPPGSLFQFPGALPGLKQRIVLSLDSSIKKCVLTATAALGTPYTVEIDAINFYAAHVIPRDVMRIPEQVVLSLPMMGCTKQHHAGSNGTHTFSVPASTDRVYVFKNVADQTSVVGTAAHEFQTDITNLEMSYAGQRSPALAYSDMGGTSVTRDIMRPFWDFAQSTGHLLTGRGLQDNQDSWAKRPIFAGIFDKSAGDNSTTLTVRSSAGAVGKIGVCHVSHKVAVISYDEAGLATGLVVQENLM